MLEIRETQGFEVCFWWESLGDQLTLYWDLQLISSQPEER
jgi:hypothetical protein